MQLRHAPPPLISCLYSPPPESQSVFSGSQIKWTLSLSLSAEQTSVRLLTKSAWQATILYYIVDRRTLIELCVSFLVCTMFRSTFREDQFIYHMSCSQQFPKYAFPLYHLKSNISYLTNQTTPLYKQSKAKLSSSAPPIVSQHFSIQLRQIRHKETRPKHPSSSEKKINKKEGLHGLEKKEEIYTILFFLPKDLSMRQSVDAHDKRRESISLIRRERKATHTHTYTTTTVALAEIPNGRSRHGRKGLLQYVWGDDACS